ncbi:MAG: glycoside hydrolase family 3 C-terminal domain-containing protein [Bacteroidaceae bacterium]|nr:glycoside hydrolase family 3 C-terminal domain-containing protein [Bacteroidaceae bacterium]
MRQKDFFGQSHWATIVALLCLFTLSFCAKSKAQTYPYQNPELSAHERAVDLCSRLTLEEKALLMLDESPAIPRMGIKKFFWWSEALHGAANQGNVTVYPEPVGMAASFNPDMVYKVFDVASTEFRAQYNKRMHQDGGEDEKFHSLSVWTPNVNIFRDPRWGRGQETYGEDPYLTSVMGTQVVRGLQGPETSKYRKLWACAKHYAVHSGPEYTRHTANLNDVSLRDLYETYLPAFKTLVEDAKVREVMCAYQRLDDEPCCGSTRLLQQILRDDWGFKYLVVSDCGAISDFHRNHKTSSDAVHAAKVGALAGTDVECGWEYVYHSIPEAVRRGLLTEADVDKHVVRLLEGRFDLGEMDAPELVEWSKIPYSAMSTKESAQKALDMARQSIVLLQNKGDVLPLRAGKERIAVIGPNADNTSMMWGNYNGTPNHTVTILDGVLKKQRNAKYLKGCDLTNTLVMDSRLATECAAGGKRGLRGTFWNNTQREGKAVTTQYYTTPVAVTTAGMHNFAPGVAIEDFSATYETTFTPKAAGEYVVNVEGTGHYEVYVDGERKQRIHSWRTTPTRTAIQAEAGHAYKIEVRYEFVKTWGADIKIDVAKEQPIDYDAIIAQLKGIEKVVFVGGISPALEGEEMPVNIDGFKGGDRTSIELPAVQRNFLKALKAAGKTVVFVNCSGSAIALTPETESCDAIVQAWYAGQEGGTAVADVLFGAMNPSGKLPVTFYRTTEQLPDYEDYSMRGRTYRYFDDPLFAFGYGLSYTTFELGTATVKQSSDNKLAMKDLEGNGVALSVDLSNTGKRDGAEVVQLYVRDLDDTEGPLRSLRGFKRVDVKAGKSVSVELQLTAKTFELFDPQTNTVHSHPGRYELLYGTSSRAGDLKSMTITLE